MKIEELKSMPKGVVFIHEIMDDGTLKTTSPGKVDAPIHSTAEKLLLNIQADMNSGKGKNSRQSIGHSHSHHGHTHTHGGHTHSH